MPASNVCWGVEIGSGGIKAIKLESDGDTVNVLEFAVLNHPKVLSTPELDTADAMRVALGTLASRFDLSGASLAVSVPGHQSFARFAKLPPVEPKKVPDIVKFEAVQQIPFPLEEVEWDYQTFVSPDSPDVEVGIFAVTRPRIMELLGQVGDVGLTPEIATLSPVAAFNALAFDLEFTEKTPGTIILDVGTIATDLIIAEAGRVWVRTFPLGGHQFTDALVTSFKLSYSKAERLKREAEQTKHARHVFQAMRPVFTDLVQEVQRSIGYYQSVHPGADLKRLIGLGSTFRLPGLRKYLKQQLHIDIYRIEGFKRLKSPEGREAEFNEASLNLVTAYGLALQGLGFATLEANVMPVQVMREALWRRKRVWFGAAAGLAAAATAGWFVRPLMDTTAMNAVTEPADIQRVVSEGNRLKAEAEAAGVLGDATGDTTASTLIGLLADRGVYASLVNDVGLMFEDLLGSDLFTGEAGAPTMRLARLDTEYEKPDESAAAAPAAPASRMDPRSDPRMGTGGGSLLVAPSLPDDFMMMPQVQQRLSDASFPDKLVWQGEEINLKTKRRVNVSLEIATNHPVAEDVAEALSEWLREHQYRSGTPYIIVTKDDDTEVYAKTTPLPPVPSSAAASIRPTAPRARPTGGGGGGGGLIVIRDPLPGLPGMPGAPAARPSPGSMITDDPVQLVSEMEKIAPIARPEQPIARPGIEPTETGYRLTWTLLLDLPAGIAGGGDS